MSFKINKPILYSFRRCPYAMRARMAIFIANIECELREVLLRDKPAQMLQLSPKGTVPVLQLKDKVIDESIEIIEWVLKNEQIFVDELNSDQEHETNTLINLFDGDFKFNLDRYKYSQRYEEQIQINTERYVWTFLVKLMIKSKANIFLETIFKKLIFVFYRS